MISNKWIKRKFHKKDMQNDIWEYHKGFKIDPTYVLAIGLYDKNKPFAYPLHSEWDHPNYNFYTLREFLGMGYLEKGFIGFKHITYGLGLYYLKIGLKLIKNAKIGIPEKECPFILKNDKLIVYIAPRVVRDDN